MNTLRRRFPVYSKLLSLYPYEYRQAYGQQILQTTADMLDDTSSKTVKVLVWLQVAADLILSIYKQWHHRKGKGVIMRQKTLLRGSLILGLTFTVFMIGSFIIFANLFPSDTKLQAMILTLPAHTDSLFTNYALTVFQGLVLASGISALALQFRQHAVSH